MATKSKDIIDERPIHALAIHLPTGEIFGGKGTTLEITDSRVIIHDLRGVDTSFPIKDSTITPGNNVRFGTPPVQRHSIWRRLTVNPRG